MRGARREGAAWAEEEDGGGEVEVAMKASRHVPQRHALLTQRGGAQQAMEEEEEEEEEMEKAMASAAHTFCVRSVGVFCACQCVVSLTLYQWDYCPIAALGFCGNPEIGRAHV